MTRSEFIESAWDAAVRARQNGAKISVPVAVGQAALESNYNQSQLAQVHNNLFGIKGEYKGNFVEYKTREQLPDGTWVTIPAKFRSYPSWQACFEDYGSIISRLPWYADAEEAAHSPRDFLRGLLVLRDDDDTLIEPGWATDKDYFDKVWGIVSAYGLDRRQEIPTVDEYKLLQVYDGSRRYDFHPLKMTPGLTKSEELKLMVRVRPTTFWEKIRFILWGQV